MKLNPNRHPSSTCGPLIQRLTITGSEFELYPQNILIAQLRFIYTVFAFAFDQMHTLTQVLGAPRLPEVH
jgi:hypothetical protein